MMIGRVASPALSDARPAGWLAGPAQSLNCVQGRGCWYCGTRSLYCALKIVYLLMRWLFGQTVLVFRRDQAICRLCLGTCLVACTRRRVLSGCKQKERQP